MKVNIVGLCWQPRPQRFTGCLPRGISGIIDTPRCSGMTGWRTPAPVGLLTRDIRDTIQGHLMIDGGLEIRT